jgi:hypothetical protein
MTSRALAQTLRDHQIRSVINLRGPNPEEAWYRDELATTLEADATQFDIPLSSCVWMSRVQLRGLIRVLDRCEYPAIIHCAWGSERTGLTSAISVLLSPDGTLAAARSQLSAWYLYVPVGDGKIMSEFLDQYERWLTDQKLAHRADLFRRWVENGYQPGRPNREAWPYDPSPLVVETRPAQRDDENSEINQARSSSEAPAVRR